MNAQAKIEVPTLADMRKPFTGSQISKLPKETRAQIEKRKNDKSVMVWKCAVCGGAHHKDAVHLDYVGHAALTDRLLDVDPVWSWEPVAFNSEGLPALDRNGGLWIKLTVLGVTRLGYGSADGKSGGDAIKEIIGDALRNAAMRFGAALDLWHKGDLHGDEPDASEKSDGDAALAKGMPDAEWAKLAGMIKATSSNIGDLCKHYKVNDLRMLSQDDYFDAINLLNKKLAKLAREESDRKASQQGEFAGADSDCPF